MCNITHFATSKSFAHGQFCSPRIRKPYIFQTYIRVYPLMCPHTAILSNWESRETALHLVFKLIRDHYL